MSTLNVSKEVNGTQTTIFVEGRVDTSTASHFEEFVKENSKDVEVLVFDLDKLAYISSTGLRVLLSTQKLMNKQGKMIVKNVKDEIMDVFELTGFVDILTIE